MSVSPAHLDAFFREIAEATWVWTVEDDGGVPAPRNTDGVRATPFWSRASRAQKVIQTVDAYAAFDVREVLKSEWVDQWLPRMRADGILVGINWSGSLATGFDLAPDAVLERLRASR